jgi:hypothetical protein
MLKTQSPVKNLPKAGSNTSGPDKNLLQEFFDAPAVKEVQIDGKTVKSKFNPVTVPSKFPCAKSEAK